MDNTQLGIVIATNPVDGSTATSFLPVGHKGRCAVKCEGSKRDHWSILPHLTRLSLLQAWPFATKSADTAVQKCICQMRHRMARKNTNLPKLG